MAYLQELLQVQQEQINLQQQNNLAFGLQRGEAYTSYFPTWEVTAPQYPIPAPWSLSALGYKTNEVAYACISLKMKSISEPPLRIYDKVEEEFIDDGKNEEYYRFMENPCPGISETDFHKANQMYLDIAGFMAWETDMANDGSLLNVWPVMPHYCSFMRGQGKLLRAIHYLPYTGLPAYDIVRERIVLMMEYDPQYFGLKPLSPTAVMADVIKVDNDMTLMLQKFIQNGAFVSVLLSTDQILNEADAKIAQQRFNEAKGGPANAGQALVLGKGFDYKPMGQTFREMVFPEVDARSETRICMGYSVPPILVSAKSGMDRATYSNYEQARKAWYEEYVTSQWKFLAEQYTRDILPHFTKDKNLILKFDTKDVKALQEDRTAQWKRADEGYKSRLINRNEGRIEKGLEPLPDNDPMGTEYYEISTQMEKINVNPEEQPNGQKPKQSALGMSEQQQMSMTKKVDEDDEEKKFRSFAKRRIKEGKYLDIPEYEFKYLSDDRQKELIEEYTAMVMIRELEHSLGEKQ